MLSVVFGKTSSVYRPDETLSGDVVLDLTTRCAILDLTVHFCGISSVSLIVSEGEGGHKSETVEETDIHLDVLDHLVRSYRGVDLEPGVNTYPFSLCLPPHLPSSHVSSYGNINYYLHVHLQTAAATLDFRKPFYVVAPVNINIFYACQRLQSAEVTKKYGLFNKTLRLRASVLHVCYVPGDVVSVVVDVSNNTSKQLQYLFCTLKQITTVVVQLGHKAVSRITKQCLKTEAIRIARSSRHHSWACQMTTPSSLTPTIANSSLVQVTYSIQVAGKLAGVSIPPEVEIPIVFGVKASVQPTQPQQPLAGTNRPKRISQFTLPSSSVNANVPCRRRRYISQPPLRPPAPVRRISHQIQNSPSHRISITLQPLFDEAKPELYQSNV